MGVFEIADGPLTWFQVEQCNSWPAIQEVIAARFTHPGRTWVFRGQQDTKWELKSSLERVAKDQFGLPLEDHAAIEWRLKRQFSRNLQRFTNRIPSDSDYVEWLALMQHHGAPTRLLDWTYSPYVALFFAIERALPGQSCAVWAIHHQWLVTELHNSKNTAVRRALRIDKSLKATEAVAALLEGEPSLVVPLVPWNVNERLAVQQGVFLAPMNLNRSFMENLRSVASARTVREHVIKLEIPLTVQNHWYMLAWLHRLNVNRLSLFPGIDGFASSLQGMVSWMRSEFPDWKERRATERTPNQAVQRPPPKRRR